MIRPLRKLTIQLCGETAGSDPRRDKLIVLRGQLTILRRRCEEAIPIDIGSVARAEELALQIEAEL
jgi:hypothetical protein